MPDFETHVEKYKHNKRFVHFGINNSKEKFDDWEIVGNFYASVHLIEAILYKEYKEEPHNHETRISMMLGHPDLFDYKRVLTPYTSLSGLAWTARYRGMIEIDPNDALKAQQCLEDMESELQEYITA